MTVTRTPQGHQEPFLPAPRAEVMTGPGGAPRRDLDEQEGRARPSMRRWVKVAAYSLAALAATVACGIALGVGLTSASPIGVLNPDPVVSPPPAIKGSVGLTPGARALHLPLAGTLSARPTAVEPAASHLPAACPASAWQLGLGSGTPVELLVRLAADAPEGCQGFSAPLPVLLTVPADGGTATQVVGRTAAAVTVARLATPGVSVVQRGGLVVALPIAPLTGPAPSGYAVEVRDAGAGDDAGWTTLCRSAAASECLAPDAEPREERQYRVTASLGPWHRSSAAVRWISSDA